MAHPLNHLRDHKVQHARVSDITAACGGGMSTGGGAIAAQKRLLGSTAKKNLLRASGGAVKARSDRPARAWGGRTGKKKKSGSKHTVNVIVAPHAPGGDTLPKPPMAPPGVAAGPPPMPPPMAPKPMAPPPPGPMGGPPGVPGMPPGVPPPMRKRGGAVFSGTADKGAFTTKAKVKASSNDATSANAGAGKGRTGIQRSYPSNKQDTPNIGRGSVITKATGGPIMSDSKRGVDMGPKFSGGGMGGIAKLEKLRRLEKTGYGKPGVSIMNPTQNPKPGSNG